MAELLEVVVQKPRMVERGLQDQRLAPGHGRAEAAMQGAVGELLADHDVGRVAPGLGLPTREAATFAARPPFAAPPRLPGRAGCRYRRLEEWGEPVTEILTVIAPHGLIRDPVCHLVEPCFQRRAALRGVELMPFRLARPQHARERPRRLDDIGDGLASR